MRARSTPTWTPPAASCSSTSGTSTAPDVTATLDYDTAKAMMVDANPQAAMQAFMAGKIKLQGDMTKAMAMQTGPVDPELTKKIQEITA